MYSAVRAADQFPFAVVENGLDEFVGQAHRVVGVLPGHGDIGFRIPIRIVGREFDIRITLAGEVDDPLDVVVRDHGLAAFPDGGLERRVLARVEAILGGAVFAGGFHVLTSGQDLGQVLLGEARAGHQRGDLLLFLNLPVDVLLDVRMIDVDDDHLGRPARGAAGFDGARGPVADLEEAHQARRLAAARQGFVLTAQGREVGPGARAVLEQPCLTDPKVHDPAVAYQVVVDALDEAGMGLRMLIGGIGGDQLAGLEINVMVTLGRAVDAVSPMKARVEPLRRIGRGHLLGQHEAHFVEIGLGVGFGIEVPTFPAPVGPGAGQPVEHLLGAGFAGESLFLGQLLEGGGVGFGAPQPRRDGVLLDLLQLCGDTCLAEVFLRQHVRGDLGPGIRNLDIRLGEHDGAVRVSDLAGCLAKFDRRVR